MSHLYDFILNINVEPFLLNNSHIILVADDYVVYYHSSISYIGTSLVVAQDDPCSKYGLDINLPGTSCVDI